MKIPRPPAFPPVDKNELYLTMLDGLSRYLDNPFARDLVRTVSRHPLPGLAHSLNKNQVASKLWLLNALAQVQLGPLGTVVVLGGWYGMLSAMLLDDRRFAPAQVVSVDIDPSCQPVAETLNRRHLEAGRFLALSCDMRRLDYGGISVSLPAAAGGQLKLRPQLVINTSCEHVEDFPSWYGRIPTGMLLVLQSNDYFGCDEHSNCVADLAAFRAQAPLTEELFAGNLPLKRYRRFMLIGRK
jgi:hypothetical protein